MATRSPKYRRFSPLRLPPGRSATTDEINRIQDRIDRAIEDAMDSVFRSYSFLPPGTSPGTPAGTASNFLYPAQYVHPSGSNANDGTINAPKKTASKAYASLVSGGDLYLAPGVQWSDGTEGLGLTVGQGCRLQGNGNYPLATGWLAAKPTNWFGYGARDSAQLGTNYVNLEWGSTTGFISTRTDPGIWIAGSTVPMRFKDLRWRGSQPIRLHWDYRRNDADQSIAWANITSASRAAGVSTFTVDFPTPWTVTQVERGGANDVTMRISCPGAIPTVAAGLWVSITSTDPDFPSVNVLMTDAFQVSTYVYAIRFTQAGAVVAPRAPIGSVTAGGHMANVFHDAGDMLEVESTNSEWPTTCYMVTGIPAYNQIAVLDPYGYGSRSATVGPIASIGRYALQDRIGSAGCFDQWYNCATQLIGAATSERLNLGPGMDRGSISAGQWSWVYDGEYTGNAFPDGAVQGCRDLNRLAAHFIHGGSRGATGLFQQMSRFHAGAIRFFVGVLSSSFVTFRDMMHQWDVEFGAIPATHCVDIAYDGTLHGEIVNCTIADAGGASADVRLARNPGNVRVSLCSVENTLDTLTASTSYTVVDGERVQWQDVTRSYHRDRKIGAFKNDGTLAGKRDDVPGSFGVIQNPGNYSLLSVDLSAWTPDGACTATGSQSTIGLDLTNAAWRLTSAAGTTSRYYDVTTPAAAVDDVVIFGAWMRPATLGQMLNNGTGIIQQCAYNTGSGVFDTYVPFGGDGEWQWVTNWAQVTSANVGLTSLRVRINATAGFDTVVYMPMLLYLRASLFSANEAARIAHTFRPLPAYLQAGMAGTMEGQKLIAHGGMGVAASILSNPAGAPPPLVKWEPRYNESGASPLYAPLFSTPGGWPPSGGSAGAHLFPPPKQDEPARQLVPMPYHLPNNRLAGGTYGGNGIATLAFDPQGHTISVTTDTYMTAKGDNLTFYGIFNPGDAGLGATGYIPHNITAAVGGTVEYPLFRAKVRVILELYIITNTMAVGDSWSVQIRRNGSAVASSTLTFTTGTTGYQGTSILTIAGAVTDTYGLWWDGSGVGTPASATVVFTAQISAESVT